MRSLTAIYGAILFSVFVSTPARAQNEAVDGVRLRFGVSAAGGLLLASSQGSSSQILPGEALDLDVRVGVQFNRLFALYAQPSVAVGVVNGACFGMTEAVLALWAPLLFDVTIADRVSIAAGGGVAGVPGEPVGGGLHFRVAAYPSARRLGFVRDGLMVGLESRAYWLSASGSGYVGGLIMLAVGYERFSRCARSSSFLWRAHRR